MIEQNNKGEEKIFQDARSPLGVFHLPTGWFNQVTNEIYTDVLLQEITGEEEDLLAARNLTSHQKMNKLMTNCIQSIGPVSDKDAIAKMVTELVSNDRFFLIYKIREISLGKIYKFTAPCPSCNDDQLRLTDLSEIKFPSLEDPRKFAYEGLLPKSGIPYRWLVQTGKTEENSSKSIARAGNNVFTAAIYQRLESLNGFPPKIEEVKKLGSLDRNFLRNEFARIEGKIDDEIIIECPKCGHEFSVEADIGKNEFFFPTA